MGARVKTRYHRPPPEQTGAHRCYSGLIDKSVRGSQGRSERMSERSDNVVRLGCAIADELRRYWQHVVDEGVPEHMRGLVERFAVDRHDTGVGAAAVEAAQDAARSGITVQRRLRKPGVGSIEAAERQHGIEAPEGE